MKILRNIFAEKLALKNGKAEAPVFNEPKQLILRISEVLRRSEKMKEVDLSQSLVATLTKTRFPEFKSCSQRRVLLRMNHTRA